MLINLSEEQFEKICKVGADSDIFCPKDLGLPSSRVSQYCPTEDCVACWKSSLKSLEIKSGQPLPEPPREGL